jgi:hypothetical protein
MKHFIYISGPVTSSRSCSMLIKEMICERLFSFPMQCFYKDYPGVGWKPTDPMLSFIHHSPIIISQYLLKKQFRLPAIQRSSPVFLGAG